MVKKEHEQAINFQKDNLFYKIFVYLKGEHFC